MPLSSKQLSNLKYLADLGLTWMRYYGEGNRDKAERLMKEAFVILHQERK